MRTFLCTLSISAPIEFIAVSASAELGSANPTDAQLLAERSAEAGSSGSGIFDIQVPTSGQVYKPAGRVKRDGFGDGAGCPVPQEQTNAVETAADICPAYTSATSQTNRSDSREVIYRFRQLSTEDQQALIEFLKQL